MKTMQNYLYTLVRYVPDFERMEPINVGVILQGMGRLDACLSRHAAKRKDIDTQVFQQWRKFFLDEIRGDATPLFQPEKTSPQFLTYLQQLCEGAVLLSRPLALEVAPSRGFDDVLRDLYNRLVAPPETTSPAAARRPTGRFRQLTEARHFLRRGLKKHAHVMSNERPLWMAYRQLANRQHIAIDKVEVDREIGATANEIERMPLIIDRLPEFLRAGRELPTSYYLVADELKQPFSDQSQAEFQAMRDELEAAVEKVKNSGGRIVRSLSEAERLADEVDHALPELEASATQD